MIALSALFVVFCCGSIIDIYHMFGVYFALLCYDYLSTSEDILCMVCCLVYDVSCCDVLCYVLWYIGHSGVRLCAWRHSH